MLYEQTQLGDGVFYILEAEPFVFLKTLPPELQITGLKLMASVHDVIIYPEDLGEVATMRDLLNALQVYPEVSIDNLQIALEVGLEISIHDDMEITLLFPKELYAFEISQNWLEMSGYDAHTVWTILKQHPKSYVLIEPPNQVKGVFENMDAYFSIYPA